MYIVNAWVNLIDVPHFQKIKFVKILQTLRFPSLCETEEISSIIFTQIRTFLCVTTFNFQPREDFFISIERVISGTYRFLLMSRDKTRQLAPIILIGTATK